LKACGRESRSAVHRGFPTGLCHSFATEELSDETIKAIAGSRMDARHVHPDPLLDPE
jgi:hypothetical protein